MKRIVVVLLMFALVAGATFADLTVNGTVETRMYLLDRMIPENKKSATNIPLTFGFIHTAAITLTGRNDSNTAGMQLRVRAEDITAYISGDSLTGRNNGRFHKAYVWWKPINQLRIFLGQDPDGLFENAVLTGWSFHMGNEEYIGFQNWDFWRDITHGNWDTMGLAFSYYPVEGVQVNLVIPTGGPADQWPRHQNGNGNADTPGTITGVTRAVSWENMFPWGLRLTSTVGIPDIGQVMFSYIGPQNYKGAMAPLGTLVIDGEYLGDSQSPHFGDLSLSFLLKGPIQGLQAQVGFSTKLARPDDDVDYAKEYPFQLMAAAHYTSGNLGIKFRVGMHMYDDSKKELNIVHGNIMPTYSFGAVKTALDIGLSLNGSDDVKTGFWITPYVTIGPFQGGILLYTVGGPGYQASVAPGKPTSGGEPPLKIAIPIRMVLGF